MVQQVIVVCQLCEFGIHIRDRMRQDGEGCGVVLYGDTALNGKQDKLVGGGQR